MAQVVTSSIDPTSHRTRSTMILPKEYASINYSLFSLRDCASCHFIFILILFLFLFLFLLSFIISIFLVSYYTYFCQFLTVSVLNCKIVFALERTCPRARNKSLSLSLSYSLFFESLYSTCNSLFDTLSLISSLDSKCK